MEHRVVPHEVSSALPSCVRQTGMSVEGSRPSLSIRKYEDVRPQPERNTHWYRTLKICLSPFKWTLDIKVIFCCVFPSVHTPFPLTCSQL